MKKILFFLMLSCVLSAQKTQTIPLKQSIKDRKKTTKSITVLDLREDKTIGAITHNNELYDIKFENDSISPLVEKWFLEDNKTLGNKDLVFVIKKLKAYDEVTGKTRTAKINVEFASFVKRNNKYYFVQRSQKTLSTSFNPESEIQRVTAHKIGLTMSQFITDSYQHAEERLPLDFADLNNYEEVFKKQNVAIQATTLADGVYENYEAFAKQTPNADLRIIKNKKGEVTSFRDSQDYRIFNTKVYAYVVEGIPFKVTQAGFMEIMRDDRGFYIISSREELFPQNNNSAIMVGAAFGGIGGAVAGIIINSAMAKKRKAEGNKFYNIYLDTFTGDFVFDK
ncbi:MAG: hypothetical protein KBS61_04275 [Chryseobacterium sp.]|nr:hypothetical protein [Candidatus Chryseobacterium enterohippi]